MMHAEGLLHNLFDKTLSFDKRIRTTLFSAADSLIRCRHLSTTLLGRVLKGTAKIKHKIKRMDRLFGNVTLYAKKREIYQTIVFHLVKTNKRPVILIDWSGLTPCGTFHFLRASITVKGRSLTLYEETHPLREYGSPKAHKSFLKTLQGLLPQDCRPIIITDAGFRNTWFEQVLALGWDYIGRVRNRTHYYNKVEKCWEPIKMLYGQATMKAKYLGQMLLSKSNAIKCHFYIMRQEKKARKKRNLAGKEVRCSSSLKHAKREKEPWLLVTSIAPVELNAVRITLLYKKRMQIEGSFRDLKNMNNGLGLRHCRSLSQERLNVALLIAALAIFALWIFGVASKIRNLHYSFQSNTEKKRAVLSNFTLGWQVLMCPEIKFSKEELIAALNLVVLTIREAALC